MNDLKRQQDFNDMWSATRKVKHVAQPLCESWTSCQCSRESLVPYHTRNLAIANRSRVSSTRSSNFCDHCKQKKFAGGGVVFHGQETFVKSLVAAKYAIAIAATLCGSYTATLCGGFDGKIAKFGSSVKKFHKVLAKLEWPGGYYNVSKNVPSLTDWLYSFNTHPPIFIIFGTS